MLRNETMHTILLTLVTSSVLSVAAQPAHAAATLAFQQPVPAPPAPGRVAAEPQVAPAPQAAPAAHVAAPSVWHIAPPDLSALSVPHAAPEMHMQALPEMHMETSPAVRPAPDVHAGAPVPPGPAASAAPGVHDPDHPAVYAPDHPAARAPAPPRPLTADPDFRLPPRGWAAQDPADSLWRAARSALDAGNARQAAGMYRQIRTEPRFAESEYRSHAYYWEAFARNRIGGASELNAAIAVLRELRTEYPDFENMREVDRLESRIDGQLASRGDASAASRRAEQMAQALTDCPDQELRIAVLEALISSPAELAMPTLRQVMERRDECSAPLREKALFIISQQRTPEAEDLLVEAARNDPDPKVREQGVFWLSQVNTDRAVSAIDEILRTTDDPELMEHAVFALSQHRSARAAEILRDIARREDAPIEARKNAIFWLGQGRADDLGEFLRSLYDTLDDPDLKEAAIFALSQNGRGDHADFLFEIALDPDEPVEMRKNALFWAGQQRALPLDRLAELYETMPDREMREQIIFTISQRREPEAVDLLIEIVRAETDVELRKNAIFWLGQSRDPRATRFLTELIGG